MQRLLHLPLKQKAQQAKDINEFCYNLNDCESIMFSSPILRAVTSQFIDFRNYVVKSSFHKYRQEAFDIRTNERICEVFTGAQEEEMKYNWQSSLLFVWDYNKALKFYNNNRAS